MTFETKRIEVPSGSTLTEIVDTRMAEMSADGWELVAVVGSAGTHYLYYQRVKQASGGMVDVIETLPLPNERKFRERFEGREKKGKADV